MAIDTKVIPTDVTITPVHKLDDDSDTTHTAMAVGDTEIISTIQNGLFKHIEFGFDGVCSGTVTPTIKSVALLWNGLPDERAL